MADIIYAGAPQNQGFKWNDLLGTLIPLVVIAGLAYAAIKYLPGILSGNSGGSTGTGSTYDTGGGLGTGTQQETQQQQQQQKTTTGGFTNAQNPCNAGEVFINGQCTTPANAQEIEEGQQTNFAIGIQAAAAKVQSITPNPAAPMANVKSGASWTEEAEPATPALQAEVAAWTPPGQPTLEAIQSGRDQPIAGQVAVYNPATGNAWGGNISTVQALYGAEGKKCDPGDANCLAEQAWEKDYG